MASKIVSSLVTKIGQCGSSITKKNTFTRQYVQAGSGSHSHQDVGSIAKRGLNEALRTGENLKNKAASTTEDIAKNSEEAAHRVAEKAQETWESTKDAALKTKDNAFDMANEAKETVEETVDRSMNTKNNPNC
ncbi:hypothetical protein RND81_04G227600 [Saponaria officinalis]|uniref:Late embryogenesis abundant protein n=1 Tax=Saponaria officinalis TaxID=3572 RepID=A0AAW1LRH2_SAPOF